MATDGMSETPQPSHRKDKRLANLKPRWKPGESGNLKGMPPGTKTAPKTFTELAKKYLDECDPNEPLRTRAERIIAAMYAAWEDGDQKAGALILDRVDPALKKIEVTGVAADHGSAMLDRLMKAQQLPVQPTVTQIVMPLALPRLNGNGHANGNGH